MLLHVCCAPCLAGARASLAAAPAGSSPTVSRLFFYNPNIHPLLEFRRREKALRVYLERDPFPAEIASDYGLRLFLEHMFAKGVLSAGRRERCAACYRLRLEKTAAVARAGGLDAFSSTLLASREQDRDLVAEIGTETAARHGLTFVVDDWRRVPPGEKMLRGIYRQQYCGCIFSEEERYRDGRKHLHLGHATTE